MTDLEKQAELALIVDLVASFFAKGGRITQCQPGSAIRDDDGLSPRQIGQQTYAVRQEKATK